MERVEDLYFDGGNGVVFVGLSHSSEGGDVELHDLCEKL